MTGFKKEKKDFLLTSVQRNAYARWISAAGGSRFFMETNAKYLACFINPQICKICCASE